MHMYSNNASTIATISSLTISQLFPACFSFNNNFNLLQSSSGSDDENIVDSPESLIAGDFSNFIRVLSQVEFLSGAFKSKCISFAKSYINFLSDKLARSTV